MGREASRSVVAGIRARAARLRNTHCTWEPSPSHRLPTANTATRLVATPPSPSPPHVQGGRGAARSGCVPASSGGRCRPGAPRCSCPSGGGADGADGAGRDVAASNRCCGVRAPVAMLAQLPACLPACHPDAQLPLAAHRPHPCCTVCAPACAATRFASALPPPQPPCLCSGAGLVDVAYVDRAAGGSTNRGAPAPVLECGDARGGNLQQAGRDWQIPPPALPHPPPPPAAAGLRIFRALNGSVSVQMRQPPPRRGSAA